MKDRPILFSAPMVRALLDGTKTQTRRAVKHPAPDGKSGWHPTATGWNFLPGGSDRPVCPYGRAGDRLWVRERWWQDRRDPTCAVMDADGFAVGRPDTAFADVGSCANVDALRAHEYWRCKPSIHMPRWASRINLEVTDVRVERLQDISEADAIAEGIPEEGPECSRCHSSGWLMQGGGPVQCDAPACGDGAVDAYRALWEQINSAGRPVLPANENSKRYARVKAWLEKHPDTTSWAANPWVWVVEFKRIGHKD